MSTPAKVGSPERPGYEAQVDTWARSAADLSGLSARVRSDVLACRAEIAASTPSPATGTDR